MWLLRVIKFKMLMAKGNVAVALVLVLVSITGAVIFKYYKDEQTAITTKINDIKIRQKEIIATDHELGEKVLYIKDAASKYTQNIQEMVDYLDKYDNISFANKAKAINDVLNKLSDTLEKGRVAVTTLSEMRLEIVKICGDTIFPEDIHPTCAEGKANIETILNKVKETESAIKAVADEFNERETSLNLDERITKKITDQQSYKSFNTLQNRLSSIKAPFVTLSLKRIEHKAEIWRKAAKRLRVNPNEDIAMVSVMANEGGKILSTSDQCAFVIPSELVNLFENQSKYQLGSYVLGSLNNTGCVDGILNGSGYLNIYWTQNGKRRDRSYSGQFLDGVLEGKGTVTFDFNIGVTTKFTRWAASDYGVIRYLGDGTSYEGTMKDFVPNGRGRLVTVGGEVYEGDFVDGTKHGYGTLTGPSGRQSGKFIHGVFFDEELIRNAMSKVAQNAFYCFHPTGHFQSSYTTITPPKVSLSIDWRGGILGGAYDLDIDVEVRTDREEVLMRMLPRYDSGFFPPNPNCRFREWQPVSTIMGSRYQRATVSEYFKGSWGSLSREDKVGMAIVGLALVTSALDSKSSNNPPSISETPQGTTPPSQYVAPTTNACDRLYVGKRIEMVTDCVSWGLFPCPKASYEIVGISAAAGEATIAFVEYGGYVGSHRQAVSCAGLNP